MNANSTGIPPTGTLSYSGFRTTNILYNAVIPVNNTTIPYAYEMTIPINKVWKFDSDTTANPPVAVPLYIPGAPFVKI